MITCRALAPLDKLIDYVEIFSSKSKNRNKKYPKLLFLKGKNCSHELFELNKKKKINYKEYPSLTDKYGKILYISKVEELKLNHEK